MIDLNEIKQAVKIYKESQSEEDMTMLFEVIKNYDKDLPSEMIIEISTVVDKVQTTR